MTAASTDPAGWVEAALAGRGRAEIVALPTVSAEGLDELWPEERASIERAVPSRRQQFAAGRRCARAALTRLGRAPAAIPVGQDRAPIWPDGCVGSIAHTNGLAGAVVAADGDLRSLGLDIERVGSVVPSLWSWVLTPAEIKRCRRDPAFDEATRIFSAKEAVYKATHPVWRRWLGFQDAEVLLDVDRGRFEATIADTVDHPLASTCLEGRFTQFDGHILTIVSIPPMAG